MVKRNKEKQGDGAENGCSASRNLTGDLLQYRKWKARVDSRHGKTDSRGAGIRMDVVFYQKSSIVIWKHLLGVLEEGQMVRGERRY